MRKKTFICACAAAVLVAAPAARAAEPAPTVRTSETTYAVTGSTEHEVRRELDRVRPRDYDAYTTWRVDWRFRYTTAGGGCALKAPAVAITVAFLFPRWSAPADASAGLGATWRGYLSALRRHENGHRDIAIAVGRKVLGALRALGRFATCGQAGRAANATGQRLLERARQDERAYDRRTGHGATQGAVFP